MKTEELHPNALSLAFVEALYEEFLRDPSSVEPTWRSWFASQRQQNGAPLRLGPSFRPPSIFNPRGNGAAAGRALPLESAVQGSAALQDRVDQMIRAYRVRGHLLAELDPLGQPREPQPETEPEYYGLGEEHMDLRFSCTTMLCGEQPTLRQILERLRSTYCRSIGVQFMHIDELHVKEWLQERMEATENRLSLGREEQLRILTKLTDAVIFEDFIQKKYLGAKRFSLEGAESLIPLLDLAIQKAGEHGLDEIVFGMAHRGRLNVLANTLRKSPSEIFHEFEDSSPEDKLGRGDVKYHLGYSSDCVTECGHKIHLSLCFNPSHLEFVNPVALGRMRAKQDRIGDFEHRKGMVLLIHGDAAFAGQGVIQETLNLSQLEGYKIGGTIHVIVNNQIGFTTVPEEGRSSVYATSVAKMLASPIFHVNGEDPEAVAQVVNLAMDFRREFGRDVVIDMYCYRRYGHNEGDEPSFTQPKLYAAIKRRQSVRRGYLEHLLKLGEVTREEADHIRETRRTELEEELSTARGPDYKPPPDSLGSVWEGYRGGPDAAVDEPDTGVERSRLCALLETQTRLPADFRPHPKIVRLLKEREEMARGQRPMNWAAGEALALASLSAGGTPIRMTGQDTRRGTFSHRHAALFDHEDGHMYIPLQNLGPEQAPVAIYNSPLSEVGVLGFEYGYSLDAPDALVVWEAQFGDFNNVAQVIIDQFIISAEDKWRRLSNLVLLLPHGFEGMGPEHSSARLERFLVLAADDNIQIVNPTTPAQLFHCLRRQALRPWRKPLIVMTPKSLLRHQGAVSTLEECEQGKFQRILPDELAAGSIERILLCSGKVYYDLAHEREKLGRDDVAILRLEQLYPLADSALESALTPFAPQVPAFWVQEEPENMGAWRYMWARFGNQLLGKHPFSGICRAASASPATGSASSHKMEQRKLIDAAFAAS